MGKIRKTLQRLVISMLVLTALIPQICQAEEKDVIDLAKEYFAQGDYEGGISLLEEAATEGNVQAAYDLGYYYQFGQYVEQDVERAATWYKMVAMEGYAEGLCALGKLYYEYGEGVQRNKLTAGILFQKAAYAGNIEAMSYLGMMYWNEETYEKAKEWYETVADMGSSAESGSLTEFYVSDAMYELGNMYRYGFGVEKNYVVAKEWYERAAEKDCGPAMYSLGSMYENGEGVEINTELAQEWYAKYAEAQG